MKAHLEPPTTELARYSTKNHVPHYFDEMNTQSYVHTTTRKGLVSNITTHVAHVVSVHSNTDE